MNLNIFDITQLMSINCIHFIEFYIKSIQNHITLRKTNQTCYNKITQE